jgi:hypothetical protein
MAAPFARCTKEEKCAMIYFWGLEVYQGQKSIKAFLHYMRTVPDQSSVCMNGPTSSKTVAQV